VYKPLQELEYINAKCRIQLTKTLARHHKVRTVGGPGEETEDRCRGLAYFFAFDPWETSLKYPPGSARFFDVAEKTGLLASREAVDLSKALIRHGAEMARIYNGVFSPFFYEARVRPIIENIDDLEHLSESGLAVGASWADRLLETSPVPLQPSRHLEVQSFRQITIEGEIEFYSQSPWLAWLEALDLICLGPWGGLKPDQITSMVSALKARVLNQAPQEFHASDELLGRKVNLPMFSRGLQGAVVGIFTDVPKDEMEPILTSLTQFGETLSDAYADLRWQNFIEALDNDLDEDALARELINIVSPIKKIIVHRDGKSAGYKIQYEKNYFSGYRSLSKDELAITESKSSFTINGPQGATVYIEPLADILHINPEFTRLRLENYLNQTFITISASHDVEKLPLKQVKDLRSEHEKYMQEQDVSLAKLRQYYVISQVEKHWNEGSVKITNSELKRFLEDMGRELKTGYQVTSYAADFEKIFDHKVAATKTRNALSLSWNKGS